MALLGHGISECVLMTCLGHVDSLRLTRKSKLESTWWKWKNMISKKHIYIYIFNIFIARISLGIGECLLLASLEHAGSLKSKLHEVKMRFENSFLN